VNAIYQDLARTRLHDMHQTAARERLAEAARAAASRDDSRGATVLGRFRPKSSRVLLRPAGRPDLGPAGDCC